MKRAAFWTMVSLVAIAGSAAVAWSPIASAAPASAPSAAESACDGKPEPPIDCAPSTGDLRVTPQEMADIACRRWKPGLDPADVNNQVIQDIVALATSRGGTGTVMCGYDTTVAWPDPIPERVDQTSSNPTFATPAAVECFIGGVARLSGAEIKGIADEMANAGKSNSVIRAEIEARNETAGGQGQLTCDFELRSTEPETFLPPPMPPGED